jgi:Mg2+ and Co2+ transporter CorA
MDDSAQIVLRGTYQDAIGDSHDIDEAFSPKRHWDTLVEANTAHDFDVLKEIKDELEQIRKALSQMSTSK